MSMQGKDRNIYRIARRNAGYTQEKAAELLDTSVESIRAWENDLRFPPDEIVERMKTAYDAPELGPQHLRASTTLAGDIIPAFRPGLPFGQTVCRLYRLLNDFVIDQDHDMELMRIAEDGIIDEGQMEPYTEIMDVLLVGIVQAALEVKYSDKTGYPDGE